MTITLDGTNGVTTAGITLGSTAIASTGAEINILDGVTATATELNLIDGVTSTTAELNILDGVTSTAAELNILDGVTATTAEINLIDGGATIGTTAVADGDGILINDGGTMRVSTVQTVKTYMTAGVGTSTTYGAVGTYIFGRRAYSNADAAAWVAGATSAGSGIFPAGLSGEETDTPNAEPQGRPQYNTSGSNGDVIVGDESSASNALSGTWRAMGSSNLANGKRKQPVTVLVRTA